MHYYEITCEIIINSYVFSLNNDIYNIGVLHKINKKIET